MHDIMNLSDIAPMNGEARVADIRLGEALGFERPRVVRELVERNILELQVHGNLPCDTAKSGQRGRPGKAYWLNESQALLICMFARTPNVARVRKALIGVFKAYRQGELVPVRAHYRHTPARRTVPVAIDWHEHFYGLAIAFRDQPDALAEACTALVQGIEGVLQDFTGRRNARFR